MVANRKVTGKASSMPAGLAMAGGLSMAVTLVLSVALAKLLDSGSLGEGSVGYGALVILLLSSGLGAWLATVKIKRRRLAVCMASGALYYILLICVTALFFGGQYTGMGVTALAVAGGCLTVCLLGAGQGRGRKRSIPGIHR